MKTRWIWILLVMLFIFVGCGPSASATGTPAAFTPTNGQALEYASQTPLSNSSENPIQSINTPDFSEMTPPSADTNPFVRLAKQDLADLLKIPADQIRFLKISDINWQDITKGCSPNPSETLTKGELSGYRIWLEANGMNYAYHVGLDGKIFLCPN